MRWKLFTGGPVSFQVGEAWVGSIELIWVARDDDHHTLRATELVGDIANEDGLELGVAQVTVVWITGDLEHGVEIPEYTTVYACAYTGMPFISFWACRALWSHLALDAL